MNHGIQSFDGSGRLMFDTRNAMGGVCMGIFDVPAGGATYTFPEMGPGLQGLALSPLGVGSSWSYDNAWGYPKFTFAYAAGPVALFVR